MKTIQGLRTEVNKEMATLKKTQAEILVELKCPRTQLENSKEAIQVKWIIQKIGQGLEVQEEDLEQIKKEKGLGELQ